MANFLILSYSPKSRNTACQAANRALKAILHLGLPAHDGELKGENVIAVTFPRLTATGSSSHARDAVTGSWLTCTGTWIHRGVRGNDGPVGLLQRFLATDVKQLANGMEGFFALSAYDARSGETHVATDITGSHHVYMREFDDYVAVSGSSFLLACLDDADLDPVGIREFVYSGNTYEDRTFYANVRRLDPATILTLRNGKVADRSRYWSISDLAPNSLKPKDALEKLSATLVDSVGRLCSNASSPVTDLTGGYDSRAILCGLLSAGVQPAAFVAGKPDNPDVWVARTLADTVGTTLLTLDPTTQVSIEEIDRAFLLTEGMYDLVEYAGIRRAHEYTVERGHDLSINGSYGELARGYWWELLTPHPGAQSALNCEKIARARYAFRPAPSSLFSGEEGFDAVQHFTQVLERATNALSHCPNTFQMDAAYIDVRMCGWQGAIASSTDRLRPCVSPFQMRSVIETMVCADRHCRKGSRLITELVSTLQPKIARVPLESGVPCMPMTLGNAFRFAPLVKHYAGKALRKFARPRSTSAAGSPIAYLLSDETVRAAMTPSKMITARIFGENGLGEFVDGIENREGWDQKVWSHLFTVEYTLSRLREVRASVSRQAL